MRLDKYLKVSRIIKRRQIAKDLADNGYIKINNKPAKASSEVKIGDLIEIKNDSIKQYVIKEIYEYANEINAQKMYERIE